MFTGIIEAVGEIVSAQKVGGDLRIVVAASHFKDEKINLGDSIAVNGVCLTVVQRDAINLTFDVSVESLNHSLIGNWKKGNKVNLEMALLPTTRLGGHLVSGHVDGLATLSELQQDARSWRLVFDAPQDLQKYIAKKGSITINGTSLTVNAIDGSKFDVNVIPHTMEQTTLGDLHVNDKVHIEVDLIARYLERLLSGQSKSESNIDYAFLAENGFG